MVYIIGSTYVVGKSEHIVYGSKNIVMSDVLGADLGDPRLYLRLYRVDIAAALLHYGKENGRACLLADAAVIQIVAYELFGPAGVVGEYLDVHAVVKHKSDLVDSRILDRLCILGAEHLARLVKHLAREGVHDIGGNAMVCNAGADGELFIKFVASYGRYVIFLGIKEIIIDEVHRRVDLNRLAGAKLLVYLAQ